MAHMHECPNCGAQWECGDANYQDECPYATRVLCTVCWARGAPSEAQSRVTRAGETSDKRKQS